MACCWSETQLTEHQFLQALHNDDMWEAADGGVTEAIKDGSDFLALLRGQSCAHVVLLQEGYHRLQAAALDRQLPPELRAAAQPGFTGYPPPAQLYWQPSANLLHPLQLLSRELTGCAAACRPTQPMKCLLAHLEQVPFAVVERCKLLEIQYLMKELHQHQVPAVHAQHDVNAQQPQQVQQQQVQPQQLLPEHQQVWGAAGDGIIAQQPPLCRRLSVRVVLQRLPAAPVPDEQQESAAAEGGSWQQRGLQGWGQVQQVSYTCALEYPAHTLRSADYIISAQLFDRGISNWQALQKGDAFTMPWDGVPWRGFALSYRLRKPGDLFIGSPWYSIAVEWEGHSRDPKKDPEDWLYGNPWEMTRDCSAGPPQLPDLQTALATANKAGHPVLAAPWTFIGRAVAEQAVRRGPAKRKRQGQHHHDVDFVYDDSLDEEASAAAGHDADAWDPTTEFYYDDDPEEFEFDIDQNLQPRRKSARRHGSSTGRHRRTSSRRGSPSHSDEGAGCSGRSHKAGAAAPGELTHNYGRELLARTDVCVVCRSKEGSLMSGHTGRGSACARQYHAGCLLLLNAAGIRTVMFGKSGAAQQRKHASARCSSRSGGVELAAVSAQAQQLCDGLLGVLLQQSQQADHQLSAPVLAALAAAQEAAVRVASGELVLICPSHGCQGCRLNGKLEFMVWCCCCWIRVYHHRQCVPMGAEHVQLDGRDFIRCPHCRAAGVPVPGTAAAAAAAAVAAGAVSGGASALDAAAAAAADVAGLLVAAAVADCSLAGSNGPMVTLAAQGTAGVDGAAVNQQADQQAAESEVTLRSSVSAAAADMMVIDQQETGFRHQSDKQQPLQQQQPESSDDTLQDPLLPASAAVSAAAAPAADQQQLPHAAAGQQQPEVVDLLDSELEGHEEGPVIITIESSDDADHEHAEQRQERTPEEQQGAQQHLQPQQPQQQQRRQEPTPEQQVEQQQTSGLDSAGAGEETAAAAAAAAPVDDVDMDVLAAVADIDAQLQALQQQAQHTAQTSLTLQPLQQQEEQGGSVTPSAAAAAIAAPAGQGVAAALAAAGQAADQSDGPVMPAWLQLSLDDRERHSPSYMLVPCAATDGASSSRGSNSGVGETTRVLAAAAAAARTLPPAAEQHGRATDAAAAAAAAGNVDGLGMLLAASGAADDAGGGGFSGLPLTSPQSHLLIGCIEKAEKQYKPANVWGCAMIGVPQYPDDSSPYGLAIVLDFLPSLQQQQQGNAQGQQGNAQGQVEAGAAAAAGQSSAGEAVRVRPQVFLKCSKAVAQNGRLQPAMRMRDDDERQGPREWQVLINGQSYPHRQGRNGVALHDGDVITVQGLHFKLQLSQ